jgi:hypothetical protein
MSDGNYRMKRPTMALIFEDSRQVAHLIPKGAVIKIDSEAFTENKLVNVAWEEKVVTMFAQDIRARGEAVIL